MKKRGVLQVAALAIAAAVARAVAGEAAPSAAIDLPAGAAPSVVSEPTLAADSAALLETVTIIGHIARPLMATEASVSVTDAGDIENAMALDLRDLVAREPGISVRADATRFGDESISIRGVGGNRVRLEVDGVPRAAAFAVGSFSNAGRALAELDFVDRIEILKGPASATYGSAAIGGIVAVRTLEPKDLITGTRDAAARARLQYSSVDEGRHASLVLAGELDRGGGQPGPQWLGGWLHEESGETENGSRLLAANPQSISNDAWLGKLVLAQWEEPLRLSLRARQRQVRTDVDSLLLQPGRFANTVEMRGDDRADEWTFAIDRAHVGRSAQERLEWKLWVQRAASDQRTFETRRAVAPRTPAATLDRRFNYEVDAVGGSLVAAHEATYAAAQHLLALGVEASAQQITEWRDGTQTTLPSGPSTTTILGEVFPVRDFPKSRVLEAGAFVFDEISREGSRVTWSPALRVDHYRLDPRDDPMYAEDNPTQKPVSVHTTAISPRLGVSLRVRDDLVLFGQYTHGFRSPPFEDVNIGLDIALFRYRALPNPDLRPERSDHLEFGVRSSGEAVSGSASVFAARYRDFIESRVSLGLDTASGYTLFQSRNRARAKIFGAEAKFDARLGSGPLEERKWTATLAVAYSRGEDATTGRALNSIDPPRASLSLKYGAPGSRWQLETLLAASAAQDRIDQSAGPLARAPGHATVDVLGRYSVSEKIHLRAAILNVLDRRYVEWADIRGRTPDDPSLPLYTRAGRSVTLGATLRLD